MSGDNQGEIWSEFFRIKNMLMDYDDNLRTALGDIRMLMKLKRPSVKLRDHYSKAQKHVGYIIDMGIACGAISTKNQEMVKFCMDVSKGEWKGIEDFEKCQEFFRECYRDSKFYEVAIKPDSRPAIVRKYGRYHGD